MGKEETTPLKPRKCKYCKGVFAPTREDMIFCQESHRKLFWKYGGLPYEKLMVRVEKAAGVLIADRWTDLDRRLRSDMDGVYMRIGSIETAIEELKRVIETLPKRRRKRNPQPQI